MNSENNMQEEERVPHKQFIAYRDGNFTFPGAQTRHLGALTLRHSPNLPVISVSIGEEKGFLLGWPLHLAARDQLTFAEAAELCGRWLFITETTVMHDPLGSIGVVYSPELQVISSSTGVLDKSLLVETTELNRFLGLPATRNWYPFGLTPYENFFRLLPNHTLDLRTWQVTRISVAPPSWSAEECVEVITRGFVDAMEVIKSSGPLMMGITAGNETRMVLAGLRGAEDVYSFTFGGLGSREVVAGRALARITGFRYDVIPIGEPDPEASARWFEAAGRCVSGDTLRNAGAKERLPRNRLFVKGMGGEIGKLVYSKPTDTLDTVLTTEDLITRLMLPVHPELVAAGEQWRARLSPGDTFDLLTDLYMDNRMGAWSVPQTHADITTKAIALPLNKGSIVAGLRALPVEMKRAHAISPAVVEQLWPELLKVPINRTPTWIKLAQRSKRLAKSSIGR